MVRNSVFRHTITRKNTNRHNGYDYKGKIMKNTLSNQMFSGNKFVYDFIMKIDGIIYELYESIKTIKTFKSISRDKYDRNFN